MGYTLVARNKQLDELNIGAFSWPIFLQETGMGYVLGYGSAKNPASYVYRNNNNGSPVSNDNYRVTATEAKAMALVARGYVEVQRYVNNEWDQLPPEQVKEHEDATSYKGKALYRAKMHEDHLKWLETFADWADKSKGFTIG